MHSLQNVIFFKYPETIAEKCIMTIYGNITVE